MFNTPKTETITDPRTGETIERVKVPEEHVEPIMKRIHKVSALEREFSSVSQQCFGLFNNLSDRSKELGNERLEMHRTLQLVCKKMGIPKDNWVYNISDKVMELRKAPKMVVQGTNPLPPIQPIIQSTTTPNVQP